MVPGPVRVALAVDAGIAAVFAAAAVAGVPDGRLGPALVAAEAVAWSAVVLAWAFPAFWSTWLRVVERRTPLDDAPLPEPATLAPRPSTGALAAAGAALVGLLALQALLAGDQGVAFRTVVNLFGATLGVGAVSLAVVHDVRWMLAATAESGESAESAESE